MSGPEGFVMRPRSQRLPMIPPHALDEAAPNPGTALWSDVVVRCLSLGFPPKVGKPGVR